MPRVRHFQFLLFFMLTGTMAALSQPANDLCEGAEPVEVLVDTLWRQIDGTTDLATTDFNISCESSQAGEGVWYAFVSTTDAELSLKLRSTIMMNSTVLISSGDCDELIPLQCENGWSGSLLLTNLQLSAGESLFVLIFDRESSQGTFDLFYSAVPAGGGAVCALSQTLEPVARTGIGPISGPYAPGDSVTFCYTAIFTSIGNNCQWIQGVVPVFGAGWDPGSFESGPGSMPINATLNGQTFPASGQASGGTTWEWFTDARYHHPHQEYFVGQLDGNGSLDMCSVLTNPDCPDMGLAGHDNGPCWDAGSGGDLLPGGWFAWGIDGLCPGQTGHPAVDYGDGNCCSCNMGPWQFCWDLVAGTESTTPSILDPLSVEVFNFADGETGAWNGGPSICSDDRTVIFVGGLGECDTSQTKGFVSGQLFLDVNDQCEADAESLILSNTLIRVTAVSTGEQFFSISSGSGDYFFELDTGSYWVTAIVDDPLPGSCPDSFLIEVDEICNMTQLNLPTRKGDLCSDIDLSLLSNRLRPCMTSTMQVRIFNNGLATAPNSSLLLTLDSYLTLESASVGFTALGNNQYQFDEIDIEEVSETQVFVEVTLDCDAPVDYLHCSTVEILEFPCPDNPQAERCIRNTRAIDPNIKVSPPDLTEDTIRIDPLEPIIYEIHFQNTGSDTAFSVTIVDTLPPEVDVSSLQFKGASHDFDIALRSNHILEFCFPDILLPDSTTNEMASHGYITYEIAQQGVLPPGTYIENSASIYFDFSPPVKTNTLVHVVGCRAEDHILVAYVDTLCVSDSLVIGEEVFYAEKPQGQALVLAADPVNCDTIVNIELHFHDEVTIDSVMIQPDNGDNSGAIGITPIGGVPPYAIAWSNGSDSTEINGVPAGDYSVFITDAVDCTYTFEFTVTLSTSSNNILAVPHPLIYPNPVSDRLYFTGPEIRWIEFYTTTGMRVLRETELDSEGIDVSAFHAGVFMWSALGVDGKQYAGKVIKF